MNRRLLLCLLIALPCNHALADEPVSNLIESPGFKIVGTLEDPRLDEASGLQAGNGGVFYVHNDEKRDVFVTDLAGRELGSFKLNDAKNKDWEDIARVPHDDSWWLVIADTGDNESKRKHVSLYFFEEPAEGEYGQDRDALHQVDVRYPGGPRDVEAVSYDPSSDSILLLSKRNSPPRLYAIPLQQALASDEVEADFLAEVPGFRPPTRQDLLSNPRRGWWISQPTGMDISPDGRLAAVITYRSLYLFSREENESWADAFQRTPVEYLGPPGLHEEAVAFSLDGKAIYVTTERRPAPIYRLYID